MDGVSGTSITLTPPTRAPPLPPSLPFPPPRAPMAAWQATRDEEHAVSMTSDGPPRLSEKDRRPAITDKEREPVAEKDEIEEGQYLRERGGEIGRGSVPASAIKEY